MSETVDMVNHPPHYLGSICCTANPVHVCCIPSATAAGQRNLREEVGV